MVDTGSHELLHGESETRPDRREAERRTRRGATGQHWLRVRWRTSTLSRSQQGQSWLYIFLARILYYCYIIIITSSCEDDYSILLISLLALNKFFFQFFSDTICVIIFYLQTKYSPFLSNLNILVLRAGWNSEVKNQFSGGAE